MVLGWVSGRHMVQYYLGKTRVAPATVMLVGGICAIALFIVLRASPAGYGDMFLPRTDNSWQQWLHVSKYPPSLTYYSLELGLLALALAVMMKLEPFIGLRDSCDLTTTYVVAAIMLIWLYPECRWYRTLKTAHPTSILRFL